MTFQQNAARTEQGIAALERIRKFINRADIGDYSLASVIDEIDKDDLAEILIESALSGQVGIFEQILKLRGQQEFSFEYDDDQTLLNGKPFPEHADFPLFRYVNSARGMKGVIDILARHGMSGVFTSSTNLPFLLSFESSASKRSLELCRRSTFTAELPFLDDGVLKYPELALTMARETHFKDAYEHILCWASSSMLEAFPEELKRYYGRQEVELSTEQWVTVDEWGRMPGHPRFYQMVLGLDSYVPGRLDVIDRCLIDYMTPEFSKFGFEHEEPRFLCRTTVSFLSSFPVGVFDRQNLENCESFCSDYFPLDIIKVEAANSANAARSKNGVPGQVSHLVEATNPAGVLHTNFRPVFHAMEQRSYLQSRLSRLFTKDMAMALLCRRDHPPIDGKSLLNIFSTYGIDNKNLCVNLTSEETLNLVDAGFKFAEGTLCSQELTSYCFGDDGQSLIGGSRISYGAWTPEEVQHFFEKATAAGLWLEIMTEMPPTVDFALFRIKNESVDIQNANRRSQSLRAFLRNQGPKNCVEAADSVGDWNAIISVFQRSEMLPYLSKMPLQTRGFLLENDLGL